MSEERMGTSSSHDGHKDISNTDRVSLISAAVNSFNYFLEGALEYKQINGSLNTEKKWIYLESSV
jgi:hypothetical protein